MHLLWELFITFFVIGLVSFGGGYAMIPLIQGETVLHHAWMTMQQFSDVIAVASMSPGPIATNSAIMVGYRVAGFTGAIISAIGIVLPTLILIIALGTVFYKIHRYLWVKSIFYGMRSIITALIIYAAILFGSRNGLFASLTWHTVSLLIIFAVSLFVLLRYRIHPVYVILLSGIVGMAFYG